jgi:hypothetical protein
LRRLVGFGLSPQLKTHFEQIFSAPFLVELLLAELGSEPAQDLFFRLHYDGAFQTQSGGAILAASQPEPEAVAQKWLKEAMQGKTNRSEAAEILLQAWWCVAENKPLTDSIPAEEQRKTGWREATKGKVIEIGWLARQSARAARYQPLTLSDLGL